jgi:hypothetical protein
VVFVSEPCFGSGTQPPDDFWALTVRLRHSSTPPIFKSTSAPHTFSNRLSTKHTSTRFDRITSPVNQLSFPATFVQSTSPTLRQESPLARHGQKVCAASPFSPRACGRATLDAMRLLLGAL